MVRRQFASSRDPAVHRDLQDVVVAMPGQSPYQSDLRVNARSLCHLARSVLAIVVTNHLIPRLKPHSNGPLYNNTVIGTPAIDKWAVTFGTVRRGLGGVL